ncbi:uncharacterized protein [Amphiura filiformis]|uniref:uncharacterized protein isoform X3 n=1 Tax=Amphiura filiformis TaxID=82378 RepID=UPI003B20F346
MMMRKLIFLWLLIAVTITATSGQPDCVYLNTDWIYSQPSYELAATGGFTLNARPSLFTTGSTVQVTFGAIKAYKLLFIQARFRGGANEAPVGVWNVQNTASPTYCGSASNSLLDKRDNLAGTRTFEWLPPLPQLITGDIEFRATIIVNENEQDTVYFGLTSAEVSYTDPCDPNPCLPNGNCQIMSEPITYRCLCNNGYTGQHCTNPPDGTNPCDTVTCFNGGICTGGNCQCNAGYTGTYCQTPPFDPCAGIFCQNGGTCTGGICACVTGWTGHTCQVSTNPCAGIVCQNGGTCTGGTPICACVTGWTGPNCQAFDISICNPNPCYSGGTCIRTTSVPRGYICSCPESYSGDLCETFSPTPDECSTNPCRNGGTCNELSTGYQCECTARFTGNNCETTVPLPCDANPCLNMGTCYNSAGANFICQCRTPWMGTICNEIANLCNPNPCGDGQCQLQDGGQSFQCTCPDGSQFQNQPCIMKACSSSPCLNGGTCFNRHNDDMPQEDGQLHVCLCASTYTGINCETRELTTILPSPTLPTNITPSPTTVAPPSNPCSSSPCLNGGTCLFGGQEYICLCPATHIGDRCETEKVTPTSPPIITPTNLCNENPCMNGGICSSIASTVLICSCPVTHTGPYCETPVITPSPTTEPPNACNSDPCINGGLCHPRSGGTYLCLCLPSFMGVNCETPVATPSSPSTQQPTTTQAQEPNPCVPNLCMNNAKCSPGIGTSNFDCECSDTHTGILCETPVTTEPIPTTIRATTIPTSSPSVGDPCLPSPCLNRGTCEQSGNTYICNCMEGYSGPRCETDPCSSDPCTNGATCTLVEDGIECQCAQGFVGELCETSTDVNECASLPCLNDGNCIDEADGYRCECSREFMGDNCETIIACENYCLNNGQCALTERTRRPICTCTDGYIGEKCHFAPCTDTTCQNSGTCTEQELGNDKYEYSCECQPAYTGETCAEFVTCADNPCLNGARCLDNLNGGVTCICANGFYGTYCDQDFDECVSEPCMNNGKCIDLVNSYSCDCRSGYTGTVCETDIGDDYCGPAVNPCSENTNACINSQVQKKALCVCKTNFKGNTCEEGANSIISNVDPAARSTKVQIGALSLEPWWIALIGLVIFLFIAFIFIVICVTYRDKNRGARLPRSVSTNVIY